MEKFEKVEKIRLDKVEQYRLYKTLVFVFSVILVLGIAVSIFGEFNVTTFIASLALGLVGAVFSGYLMYSYKKNFADYVKDEFVFEIVAEHFLEPFYDKEGKIAIDLINKVDLVGKPDVYHGQDIISGSYEEIFFQFANVRMDEEIQTNDGPTYSTYFKGKWFIFKLPKDFRETIKIVERNLGANLKKLEKVETEMYEFNKKFSSYTSSKQFYYYVVTPYLIEVLLKIEKMHQGTMHYCFNNDELHIGINDSKYFLEIDINKKVTKETIDNFENEIVFVKTIIDEFRLTSIKYQEEVQ